MKFINYFQKQVVFLIIFLILESLLITDGICSPQKTEKNEFYPGDALVITFIDINQQLSRGAINVSGQYAIDSRGKIMLPLIGSLKVIGYNRYTLAEKIVEVYKPYFTEPYVTVTSLIRIILIGPFFKPGSYRISPESSLWDLIDMAGGPQGGCDLNSIKVIRDDEVVIEDLLASFEKGYSLEDIGVKSGDQIVARNRRHFGVRELFDYFRFGMSLVSLYLLITRWQRY